MARFARSGRNWEGRSWTVNPAIDALCSQIEDAWPQSHGADGTVASRTHDQTNPNSDHRPYPYNGSGVVYAVDMGEVTEDDGIMLAEQLRLSRDPRIKYVIHESRLFSSYDHSQGAAWTWRPYGGANDHLNHVHVSVWRTAGPGNFSITLGGDMADEHQDHRYSPMVEQHKLSPVPDWADDMWTAYVEAGGSTVPESAGWPTFRLDSAWLWQKYIVPMQREISLLAEEVSDLRVQLGELSDTSGITQAAADNRYVRQGRSYRIG